MYLTIDDGGRLSLEEADDFKRFHIEAAADRLSASAEFGAIAEDAGDGHYWLDADAVIALSPKADDGDWMDAFQTMLVKAAPYGFADLASRRIKAHVVAPDAS